MQLKLEKTQTDSANPSQAATVNVVEIWAAKTAKIQLLLTNQSSRESINHFTLPINQLVKLINLPNN